MSATRASTACQACGAKVRADRGRCPRCRAHLTPADPVVQLQSSRRLGIAAGVLCGAFALAVLGLWITGDRAPAPSAGVARPDALAGRRADAPPAPQHAAPAAIDAEPAERPFLDASGAGATAYGTGDYASALARYTEAVEKNPQDAESLSNLGQVLVRLNRTDEAIPYFERAVAIIPGRWAYHFNLARALGLVGRSAEAIASYREAQALFPDDYATAFNLALTLHRAGDEAAAVEQYQKAIALQPEDASFRKALGVSYEQLRKGPEAAAAYQEYLRLSPSAPDADKVRERIARLTEGQAPAAPAL